jgi:hypothetical protein
MDWTEVAKMSKRENRYWKNPDGRVDLYRAFDAQGSLLYVGISVSAINRLIAHRTDSEWYGLCARLEITPYLSRHEALTAEVNAIEDERPRFNIRHGLVYDTAPKRIGVKSFEWPLPLSPAERRWTSERRERHSERMKEWARKRREAHPNEKLVYGRYASDARI